MDPNQIFKWVFDYQFESFMDNTVSDRLNPISFIRLISNVNVYEKKPLDTILIVKRSY